MTTVANIVQRVKDLVSGGEGEGGKVLGPRSEVYGVGRAFFIVANVQRVNAINRDFDFERYPFAMLPCLCNQAAQGLRHQP